jgi:hypothetical protein
MLGGLVVFLMAINAGTMLLFSPLWFFLVPVPFGTVFAVFADKFRQTLREKTRWTRFSLTSLGIAMIAVHWLFVLCLMWLESMATFVTA